MTADAHTMIGAYVLDAVTDIERAAVERHLRDCDVCRSEADELREATVKLADGAWSVPPPRLRDNVLATISATRQAAPAAPAAPAVVPAVRRSRLRLVSAAAAVLVAASGVYVVQDQRVRAERATAEAAQAAGNLTRAVLGSPDLVVRERAVSGGGRVSVASSKLQDAGVVMLAAEAAPAGKVYQLWTISGGQPTNAGALAPGQSSAVQLVRGVREANSVGVTVETAPGSATPTQMVAEVPLA